MCKHRTYGRIMGIESFRFMIFEIFLSFENAKEREAMLAIERKNEILALLQQEKSVVVAELRERYGVTEETIRRDLDKLEKEGLAKKTYGGAVLNESLNTDLPFKVRKRANVESKQYIAEIINELVEDGDNLMLDASSTAVYAAKSLKHKKNLTIITNSVEILLDAADVAGWRILSTGGSLKEGSLALVGYQAVNMIQSYHVDKAIISCKGIDKYAGITDSSELDMQIKKAMLDAANQSIIMADRSKWGKVAFTKICDLNHIDYLVTEFEPDQQWLKSCEDAGVKLLYSQPEK